MESKYWVILGTFVIVSLLIVIVFAFPIEENICIGSDWNMSIAPVEKFCEDNNMEYFVEGFLFWKQFGCIDKNKEIHYYKVSSEGNYWMIGNKSYEKEWTGTRC